MCLQKTREFVESVGDDKFAGAESIKIKLPWMPQGAYFTGANYSENFIIQNTILQIVVYQF